MNLILRIPLTASLEEGARLCALQAAFAQVCNALAQIVRQSRCWNRVALHHMTYKALREQFPGLGSQMVCNAIYSVSRASRQVYQHPRSPFNLANLGEKPLPLLRFGENCPVYFDRHTLSLKQGIFSMYTLDGRMRFKLALRPEDEACFHEKKLREIVLSRTDKGSFELMFWFVEPQDLASVDGDTLPLSEAGGNGEIPEYLMVEDAQ